MKEIVPKDIETANQWSLVLYSRGIPHELIARSDLLAILVDDEDLDRALEEIRAFELENRGWPWSYPGAAYELHEIEGPILGLLVVASIFSLFLSDVVRDVLVSIGANESYAVFKQGQWWRPVTALTLHQDPSHLLSNMVMGGLFIVLLAQLVGGPLTWTLALGSGVIGNLLAISIKPGEVSSIGASTSVFGVLGALCGVLLSKGMRGEVPYKRPLIYLGTGLALLSFLGVGDKSTDRTAHLMGFLTGFAMGMATGWYWRKLSPAFERHALLVYTLLIGLVGGAWVAGLLATQRLTQVLHLMGIILGLS